MAKIRAVLVAVLAAVTLVGGTPAAQATTAAAATGRYVSIPGVGLFSPLTLTSLRNHYVAAPESGHGAVVLGGGQTDLIAHRGTTLLIGHNWGDYRHLNDGVLPGMRVYTRAANGQQTVWSVTRVQTIRDGTTALTSAIASTPSHRRLVLITCIDSRYRRVVTAVPAEQ